MSWTSASTPSAPTCVVFTRNYTSNRGPKRSPNICGRKEPRMLTHMKTLLAICFLGTACVFSQPAKPPVTYAIIGLTHDHAYGFIPRARNRPELQLAGIVEPNQELIAHYTKQFNLPANLFSPSLEDLLARTNIQAVATFTSTLEHRHVIEECASRHIHVMVEKPLAVSMEDARAIAVA